MSRVPPNKPPNPGASRTPWGPVVTGGMDVSITIGEVVISISGPALKVIAVLNWMWGTSPPSSNIASLQLVFGPEISMTVKK